MRDTYIIIPVYNHAQALDKVLGATTKNFKHVVCINDGSQDESGLVASKHSTVELVEHAVNLGQGGALQTGIEYALQDPGARYFITFDSDGQHDLSDAEKMLAHIKKHPELDIVLGSRFLGKAENISLAKKLTLKIAAKFLSRSAGLKLTDAHNGLRVFNRKVAERLNITMPDMAHASEIIERIAQEKFTYEEFPVTITYSEYSKAKSTNHILNSVNIVFDMLLQRISKK